MHLGDNFLKKQDHILPPVYLAALQFFALPTALYFLFAVGEPPSLNNAILKAMPLAALLYLLLLSKNPNPFSTRYSRCIRRGLLLSMIGDIFLLFLRSNDFLAVIGALTFVLAHRQYKRAFETDVWELYSAPRLLVFSVLPVLLFFGWNKGLFLSILAKCYFVFLSYIVALAVNKTWYVNHLKDWSSKFGLAGMLLFLASDFFLIYGELSGAFFGRDHIVMATYYAAQFCLYASTL